VNPTNLEVYPVPTPNEAVNASGDSPTTERATTGADEAIIAIETQALRRWGDGDPDGFLDICHPEVTYFDPFNDSRINGLPALRHYYEQLRGQVHIDRFEIINPKVVLGQDLAVLSFNFAAQGGNDTFRWNCTEAYRKVEGRWLIVQTHWSLVRSSAPRAATPAEVVDQVP
jgi:hypothetical protein